MDGLPRVRAPRRVGERTYETTTMGVRLDTRDKFDVLAERWQTSRFEVMRYLADLGEAGYIGVPAPDALVLIDYCADKAPESIEAEAVALVDALGNGRVTPDEARERIVTLIRLAGCEARASWVKDGQDEA